MSAATTIADSWMTVDDRLEPEPLVLHVPDELVARRTAEAAVAANAALESAPLSSGMAQDTFVLLRPVRRAG